MKHVNLKGRCGRAAIVVVMIGTSAALAQSTRPSVVRIQVPLGADVQDALRLIQELEAQEQEGSGPTTSPATQPSERLAKFRIRYNRTPLTTLRALSAAPDPKLSEAAKFQLDVQAGRWDEVGKAIATFPPDEAKVLYRHLLTDLMTPPPPQQGQPGQPGEPVQRAPGVAPQIFVSPEDVLGIMAAAPGELDDELIEPLGQLLARVVATSGVIEPVIDRLQASVGQMGGTDPAARRRAAMLLVSANLPVAAMPFLPSLSDPLSASDVKLLELHSRCLTALSVREEDKAAAAWEVTRALLVHSEATQKERDAAMGRAMELLPRLPKPAVNQWLEVTFRDKPEQGMDVLAGAGAAVSQNFLSRDIAKREQDLLQQKTVVDQLLSQTNDPAPWSPLLEALAALWMQEADYAKVRPSARQMSQQQRIVIDEFGNQMVQPVTSNQPPPLDPAKLLSAAPSEAWLKALEPTRQAAIRANLAHMHFKNDTPQEAMPIIETLAASHSKLSRELCAELLRNLSRVWSMTQSTNRTVSYYINTSGSYTPVMQNVVLTRLAQARNLAELSELLGRMNRLGGEPPEQSIVVSVFVSAHSQAEVFKSEDIERVFGPPAQMSSDALLALTQAMRQRLASSWRSAAVQQQQQTKRTDKETEAEVTRGYELVTGMLKARLAADPQWRLMMVQALALFDWAEFDYGKQVELAVYTARRDEAFELFSRSARLYTDSLGTTRPSEQSAMIFTTWFSAALGASDLAALTRQSTPSPTQLEQIRAALYAVPEGARGLHLSGFGRFLANSVNSLRPELKHRFLTTGMKVLGEHESAREAQLAARYYEELLTEIELHTEVEGDPIIGHSRPFGLHLMIRHTQTLGRESGGFAKYLTAQGSSSTIMTPSGQPMSYREDFEKKIREALVERFEIVSIAWHDQKVEPMSYGRAGWRQTPLAYVLLKPKDAAVDKIPPIQLDVDLADKQGTVLLPISSQVVLVDARPDSIPARPVSKIEITQLLDQRDAAEGKLSLDIKATGRGLLPGLDDLLDMSIPGFKIDKTNDLGMVISRMDTEGDRPAPISEHSWLVQLSAARNDDSTLTFKFPQAKVADATMAYKQYSDADVTDVDPQLAVAGLPIRVSRWWVYALVAAILVSAAAVLGGVLVRRRSRGEQQTTPLYHVPSTLTPFTVLDLLRRIEGDASLVLAAEHRQRLTSDITQLQQTYFAPSGTNGSGNGSAELSAMATRWVQQAR